MKKAIIIGAGFSGCTIAMLLKEKGWHVTVIEKESFVGGGCRTFFHGGHPFTYGPRHFMTPYEDAYQFLNKFVPMREIKKINYTYIEKDSAFYTYPIHEDDVKKMPEAEKIFAELESLPKNLNPNNFEEKWISRIGETLYRKYMENYNKKAWCLKSNTDMDYGFEVSGTGSQSTPAFDKIFGNSPLQTGERHEFKGLLHNCYPMANDGYNKYFDITLEGCDLRLNEYVTEFDLDKGKIKINEEVLDYDLLFSSSSPDILLNYHYGELKYVGREFHKIVLPVEFVFPENVFLCFYPNENESQTRVFEYKKLTLHKSPSTLLVLETPSLKNKLYPLLVKSEIEKAQKYLDALPPNVFSVGRMGKYRYTDIDDVILQAIDLIKTI